MVGWVACMHDARQEKAFVAVQQAGLSTIRLLHFCTVARDEQEFAGVGRS